MGPAVLPPCVQRPTSPPGWPWQPTLNTKAPGGWSISTATALDTSLFLLASRRRSERATTTMALNTRIADAQVVTFGREDRGYHSAWFEKSLIKSLSQITQQQGELVRLSIKGLVSRLIECMLFQIHVEPRQFAFGVFFERDLNI
jgi:hypothetical protein